MSDQPLVIFPVPSLVSVLLHAEKKKDSPLTESEVYELRENAVCVRLPLDEARKMEEGRKYRDLSLENTWVEFQALRREIADAEKKEANQAPQTTTGSSAPGRV